MTLKQFLAKFGKEIKKARIDKDISQEALAEKAGLHATFLSRIENGKANISLDSEDPKGGHTISLLSRDFIFL